MTALKCKICNGESNKIFNKIVLNKYQVSYYQCEVCQFIQTEEPYWLNEAYNDVITSLDIGLVYRNELYIPIVTSIVKTLFDVNGEFVDYGGGYGLFVRMMRDRGFSFFRQDKFCDNLFSKGFEYTNASSSRFELLTSFEVLEHLVEPLEEINLMLKLSDNLLFSTELQPSSNIDSWWYFTPETGQHISMYSKRSLEVIAKKFGLHLISIGNIHLFTRNNISRFKFRLSFSRIYQIVINGTNKRKSLLGLDYEKIKDQLNQESIQSQ